MSEALHWWHLVVLVLLPATLLGHPSQDSCDRWTNCRGDSAVAVFRPAFFEAGHRAPFQSNGCGTSFFRVRVQAELEECCDLHDACYSICNITRGFCDAQFRRCLHRQCALSTEREECVSTADMLASGAASLGCNAYQESQKEACRCVSHAREPPADDAVTESVVQVWQRLYSGPLRGAKSPDEARSVALDALSRRSSSSAAERLYQLIVKYRTQLVERMATTGS